MTQRKSTWPLGKDDMQILELFHIFIDELERKKKAQKFSMKKGGEGSQPQPHALPLSPVGTCKVSYRNPESSAKPRLKAMDFKVLHCVHDSQCPYDRNKQDYLNKSDFF